MSFISIPSFSASVLNFLKASSVFFILFVSNSLFNLSTSAYKSLTELSAVPTVAETSFNCLAYLLTSPSALFTIFSCSFNCVFSASRAASTPVVAISGTIFLAAARSFGRLYF
jgi:hypothetical protein